MASALSVSKVFANNAMALFDHDPNTTAATVCTGGGYKSLADYSGFAVLAMSSALTGAGITKLEIVAATSAAGANATVIKDSGAVVADAVGDFVALECIAEEIAQLGAEGGFAFTHVAARLTVANAADEAVVLYDRAGAKHGAAGLTATTIA